MDNNNISKSYNSSTGVFTISQNFTYHYGGGTSSGYSSVTGGTFHVYLVIF